MPGRRGAAVWALLVAALGLMGSDPISNGVAAYPEFWLMHDEAAHCGLGHPMQQWNAHGAPRPDPGVVFSVTGDNGQAVSAVCAGQAYTLQVSFPQARNVLLTASQGALDGGDADVDPAACPARFVTGEERTAFTMTYTAPEQPIPDSNATAGGGGAADGAAAQAAGSVQLLATTATGKHGPFMQGKLSLPIYAAGAECQAATAAAGAAAPGPAAGSGEPGAAAGGAAAAAADGVCAPSPLGYQCMYASLAGATIHYSRGREPPANECTGSAGAPIGPNAADATGPNALHFAIQSNEQGYIGLSFPKRLGQMSPAEAVLGYIDPSRGPYVSTFLLLHHTRGTDTHASNWAVRRGIARINGTTTLCFTRPVVSQVPMTLHQTLDPAAVPINFAAAESTDLTAMHPIFGSTTLDFVGHTPAQAAMPEPTTALWAHALLMMAAFGALMPAGALLARHKWLFGRPEGGLSPWWFKLHMAAQFGAIGAAVLSVVIIMVDAGLTNPGRQLWRPHQIIGLIVVCMSVAQIPIAMVRPPLTAAKRAGWRALHYFWGRLAVVLGWVNLWLGVLLLHDMRDTALAGWATALALLNAAAIVAAGVLEWRKAKLEAGGLYSSTTQAYSEVSMLLSPSPDPFKDAPQELAMAGFGDLGALVDQELPRRSREWAARRDDTL